MDIYLGFKYTADDFTKESIAYYNFILEWKFFYCRNSLLMRNKRIVSSHKLRIKRETDHNYHGIYKKQFESVKKFAPGYKLNWKYTSKLNGLITILNDSVLK